MLEEFINCEDFPTQTIRIYKYASTQDLLTGVITKGYAYSETREAWIFPQSTAKTVFTDKIVDELSNLMVTDKALESTDVIQYGSLWFECKISNDILFSGDVVTVGLKEIKEPDVIDIESEKDYILGDSWGVI